MKIEVNVKDKYQVLVGEDLLREERLAGTFSELFSRRDFAPARAAIIWDEGIDPHPVELLGNALESLGLSAAALSVEGGESCKTLESYTRVIACLSDMRLDRQDLIISVGGGSVSDLAGFTADTYMRGVHLVYLPTTLLSMVDASVGGKNALNFGGAKNLIGTFNQPDMVMIEPRLLEKLSEKEFKSGVSEVIKTAFLGDRELFEMVAEKPLWDNRTDRDYLTEVIARCIEIKAEIVEQDERDCGGKRELLNLGHTFGHAIESASGFAVSHGNAVAMGMMQAAKLAEAKFGAPKETGIGLAAALEANGLPTVMPMDRKTVLKAIRRDKKIHGAKIDFILPMVPGHCEIKALELGELE